MKDSEVFRRSKMLSNKRTSLNRQKADLENHVSDLQVRLRNKRERTVSIPKSSKSRESQNLVQSISKKLKNSQVIIQEINR